jgi:hypothetical protein
MQQVDYSTPRFRTSEVAVAAGIPAATLRSYFKRGQFRIIGATDARLADESGLPNLFSLRDALVFAVAVKLIGAGADPLEAFNVAVSDFGHFAIGGERLPAQMLDYQKHGSTLLVYWPGTGHAEIKAAKSITDPLEFAFSNMHGSQESAAIVFLNFVERRVFAALKI